MLGYGNLIDAATLGGGSWVGTLPLSNLKARALGKVARTTNLTFANTLFTVDHGVSKPVRIVGLVNHSMQLSAQFRVVGGSDPGFSTGVLYDSGWLDVWPAVYTTLSLEWPSTNFWGGRYTDAERIGVTPTRGLILPNTVSARYWRVELKDAANSDGFIQIGRVFMGAAWQSQVNALYGATSIAWETTTEIQAAISGAEYFDRRTPFRVARFSTEYMSETEGMSYAFEIQRQMGVDGEVFYVHDPDDVSHALRRQFLGRLRELSPVEYPYVGLLKTAWEVKELL
ncbi:hypothetical protein [Phenylobacterium conjunctum]|uniref:Uncharacterized protein n=1 Tax=Phenylobacterium conjunctum TaxID=1298959 RepID=A0ABW3SYP5_9CAUL